MKLLYSLENLMPFTNSLSGYCIIENYYIALMRFTIVLLLLLTVHGLSAQSITMLVEKANISIRGMSVVNDNVIWVSGTNGSVAKSIDDGKNWN